MENINKKKGSIVCTTFNQNIKEITSFLLYELDSCEKCKHNIDLIIIFEKEENTKAEKISAYLKKFIISKKLKIFVNFEGRGFSSCLNYGIQKSDSKYIFRLDTDDRSCKNRYDYQINLMEKCKHNICYSDLINLNTEKVIKYPSPKMLKIYILLGMNPLPHVSICLNKDFFMNKIGLYNDKLSRSEDFDLWLRYISENGIDGIIKCPTALTYYNIKGSFEKSRESSLSQIKIRIKSFRNNNLKLISILGILPNLIRLIFPKFIIYVKHAISKYI